MATEIFVFQKEDNSVPLLDWLDDLPEKAQVKCLQKIDLLEERGSKLGRPHADYLEDGIYELRSRYLRIRYRILYFFHGKNVAVLANGTSKTDKVPKSQIELAKRRREQVRKNPDLLKHL